MVAEQDLELSTAQSRLEPSPKRGGGSVASTSTTVSVAAVPAPVAVPVPAPVPVPVSPPSSTPASAPSNAHDEWMSHVPRDVREQFVETIADELTRIARDSDGQHVRNCATRFEAHVLERSSSHVEYVRRLEQHIASLRQQGTRSMGRTAAPISNSTSTSPSTSTSTSTRVRRRSHSTSRGRRRAHASHIRLSPAELAVRDDAYFARLHRMRTAYRDEVAIVYRELCRVHAVIQSSRALPRREATHLGDFVQNLKKVVHLLEQQPDEMHGIIPARKRTLEYLDVVETHIQRKVLPMLHRLRHTYSALLRPIVLHYLKCNARALRRL